MNDVTASAKAVATYGINEFEYMERNAPLFEASLQTSPL
jgi:hypothetical protein